MAKNLESNDNYIKVKERIINLKKSGGWDDVSIDTNLLETGTKKDVTGKEKMYVVVKAYVKIKNQSFTGMSMETEGTGDVNFLKFLENAETSAVGRALSFAGIEDQLSEDVASKEEIDEAKSKTKSASIEAKKEQAKKLVEESLLKSSEKKQEPKKYNDSNIPIFKEIPKNASIRKSEDRKQITDFLRKEGLYDGTLLTDSLIRSELSIKYKKVDDLIKKGNQGELITFIKNIKK